MTTTGRSGKHNSGRGKKKQANVPPGNQQLKRYKSQETNSNLTEITALNGPSPEFEQTLRSLNL
jgi:hypothetical protein